MNLPIFYLKILKFFKRSHFLKIFFLAFFLLIQPSYAANECAKNRFSLHLGSAFSESATKFPLDPHLEKNLQGIIKDFDPNKLIVDSIREPAKFAVGGELEETNAFVFYNGNAVGRFHFLVVGTTMRFDIEIFEGYKGIGFYEAMLACALSRSTHVTALPLRERNEQSSNGQQMLSNLSPPLDKGTIDSEVLSTDLRRQLRSQMLVKVSKSSVNRASGANGFSKLTKVVLHRNLDEIGLYYEKGEPLESREVQFFIVGEKFFKVSHDGSMRAAQKDEFSFGDFPERNKPSHEL